jgi:glycosyltransferase involved in cell wall biosynthesis
MRVTFLMPRYERGPSGGYRVVCEYANALVSRGHDVTVVHPRRLEPPCPSEKLSLRGHVRETLNNLSNVLFTPSIDWQPIDDRVKLVHVPSSAPEYIPDADAIFATAWGTVPPILECPKTKGEKCYLIQGYETWQGPKDLVDATWRSPLHKVVVSKWLCEVGNELGCRDLVYIPNGVDHDRYRLLRPIESRPRQVAMAFSTGSVKGPGDGLRALEIAKEKYPDTRVVMFGTGRRISSIPSWAEYYRNPPQDFIVSEIYNRSSIFLSSSWSEGFALPPAEAACCGCAVVASDSGGIRDFIQTGETGLLSPPKDPVTLAQNLCLLLGNDDLRVKFAKAGHSGMARLNWERSADLLEDFLTRVVERKALDRHMAQCSN